MVDNNEIIINLISRYLIGDITDIEKKHLEQWVYECEENRLFFERITSADYVRHKIEFHKSQDYNQELNKLLKKKNQKRRKRNVILLTTVSSAASVIIIALFLLKLPILPKHEMIVSDNVTQNFTAPMLKLSNGTVISLNSLELKDTINDADVAISSNGNSVNYSKTERNSGEKLKFNELIVPNKSMCPLTMSDGTKVWVNANSSIKFPAVFPGDKRVVYITGEVFFDVAEDSKRPFKVVTNSIEINVTGTSFNINSYDEQSNIEITLLEGSILAFADSTEYALKPNEQLIMNKTNRNINIMEVSAEDYSQWRDGVYIFNKRSIDDIIHIINRQWGIICILENPECGEMCITGVMNVKEGLGSFLKLLSRSSDFKYEIDCDTITIKRFIKD